MSQMKYTFRVGECGVLSNIYNKKWALFKAHFLIVSTMLFGETIGHCHIQPE